MILDCSQHQGLSMPEPKPTYAVPLADHRLGPYLSELACKVCHAILATVTEWDGRTAVILRTNEGYPVLAFRARFKCLCGEERDFESVPMSAIRLGIADQ
jgi:hypothetical protein